MDLETLSLPVVGLILGGGMMFFAGRSRIRRTNEYGVQEARFFAQLFENIFNLVGVTVIVVSIVVLAIFFNKK